MVDGREDKDAAKVLAGVADGTSRRHAGRRDLRKQGDLMKRNTLNFLIDLVSALVLLGMIVTGLVMRFVLPPGSGRARVLWTWGRHDWGDLHFWLAVAAGCLLLIHVALHWQWVCATLARMVRPHAQDTNLGPIGRNAAGAITVLLLVGLCAGLVWIGQGQVRTQGGSGDAPAGHGGLGREDGTGAAGGNSEIRGSMTLIEAASALGISVEELRKRVHVPLEVPNDERMGQLSRRLGQPMSELRKLAEGK